MGTHSDDAPAVAATVPPCATGGQVNGGSGRFATHSAMAENRVRLLKAFKRVWVGQLAAG